MINEPQNTQPEPPSLARGNELCWVSVEPTGARQVVTRKPPPEEHFPRGERALLHFTEVGKRKVNQEKRAKGPQFVSGLPSAFKRGKKSLEIKTNMNQNLFQLKQGLLLKAKRSVFFVLLSLLCFLFLG